MPTTFKHTEPRDLIELLLDQYSKAGHIEFKPAEVADAALADFAAFAADFLIKNPPIASGVVAGDFALVFQGGLTLPLVAHRSQGHDPNFSANIGAAQPAAPGTMRTMPVDDTSMPVMRGNVGENWVR